MTTGLALRVLGGGNFRIGLTKGLIIGKRKREEAQFYSVIPPELGDLTSDRGIITASNYSTLRKQATTGSPALREELWPLFFSAVGRRYTDRSSLERVGKLCTAKDVESEETITALQEWVKYQNAAYSPRTDCLLVLVKFNVFRALLSNGQMLGFSTAGEYLDDGALSPFVHPMRSKESLLSLPIALQPTKVQCQIPHHPWLDLLPHPIMRDNLIRACSTYTKQELCAVLIGLFDSSTGTSGLITWGEPWDPSGWEVTEPFLKHWGWALHGCDELLRATNSWRGKRGEPLIKLEGIDRK